MRVKASVPISRSPRGNSSSAAVVDEEIVYAVPSQSISTLLVSSPLTVNSNIDNVVSDRGNSTASNSEASVNEVESVEVDNSSSTSGTFFVMFCFTCFGTGHLMPWCAISNAFDFLNAQFPDDNKNGNAEYVIALVWTVVNAVAVVFTLSCNRYLFGSRTILLLRMGFAIMCLLFTLSFIRSWSLFFGVMLFLLRGAILCHKPRFFLSLLIFPLAFLRPSCLVMV